MATTIKDLATAAEQAHDRATHYASETKRLYDLLMGSDGKLTEEEVAKYYEAIESSRTSAKAAEDFLGDVVKELAQRLAAKAT